MAWSHMVSMAAGVLLGSILVVAWKSWRPHRHEFDYTVPVRLSDGWWFPKAEGPPPPPPPAPPRVVALSAAEQQLLVFFYGHCERQREAASAAGDAHLAEWWALRIKTLERLMSQCGEMPQPPKAVP